jgi:hypothetical protein
MKVVIRYHLLQHVSASDDGTQFDAKHVGTSKLPVQCVDLLRWRAEDYGWNETGTRRETEIEGEAENTRNNLVIPLSTGYDSRQAMPEKDGGVLAHAG